MGTQQPMVTTYTKQRKANIVSQNRQKERRPDGINILSLIKHPSVWLTTQNKEKDKLKRQP